ncbi:hypothetical protein IL306_008523 [Fusarium sp. DS 682]|nr:hypothetical protein IL306_008523 [Fusarium sp. DS 682]
MDSQSGTSDVDQTNRKRIITACLTCRHRKVKCDHAQPVCSPYDIRNRLERLEQLLERALSGNHPISQPPAATVSSPGNDNVQRQESSSPLIARAEALSTDGYDGALLMEAQGGHSRWVSSLHYSLLADEIRDVKMLLGDQSGGAPVDSPSVQATSPFPFSAVTMDDLKAWAPTSADACLNLLSTFYSNIDPVTRIVHKPTLKRRLIQYIDYTYGTSTSTAGDGEVLIRHSSDDIHTFEPLALAVFYSAVNSLSAEDTCQSREDDMARTWTLLGLAHKMALSQGLHREPSLFSSASMGVIQVEVRRRLWHQICHLDYRSAESRGQEPTISDEDFTTFLPRNISDKDLIEGRDHSMPAPAGFTDMTLHLIRLYGHHCFRRIVRGTYKLERMIKSQDVKRNDNPSPIAKLRSLFDEVRSMVDEMVNRFQTHYLQYCDPQIPEQRMAIGLATIVDWRCWSIFWLRTPKEYRESVVTPEIRQTYV